MKHLILVIALFGLGLASLPANAVERQPQIEISQGVVKWFDDRNGFGYIMPDDNGEEVFVHFSNIILKNATRLKQGQRVVYKVVVLR